MAKKARNPNEEEDLQKRLGSVVRACRRQMGITQDELAWRSNMHRTYIADIERGARNLSLRSVEGLASALQVTVGDLLTYATSHAGTAMRLAPHAAPNTLKDILLVEDNSADVALTMRAFRKARIANPLTVARSAEEALDHLMGKSRRGRLRKPQLILLDLNLPGMSGVEFLKQIKSDQRLKDIPVVVLTISRSDRSILECSELGAANYIVKPVGVVELVSVTPRLNLNLFLAPSSGSKAPSLAAS